MCGQVCIWHVVSDPDGTVEVGGEGTTENLVSADHCQRGYDRLDRMRHPAEPLAVCLGTQLGQQRIPLLPVPAQWSVRSCATPSAGDIVTI